MNDRIYIDCNTMVGKRGMKDIETPYETEDLLEEMEWCGIHGALVAHWTAKEYDPMFGNRMLMRELKKSPRLIGAWAVMPSHTREILPPRDLVKEMFDNGIHAAKMYPRSHRYPFNLDYCGNLLEELQERNVLLIVEGGHMYNPDIFEPSNQVLLTELDRILSACPDLNVLLQASRWEATRYLQWLMSKHQNLHLELSNHQGKAGGSNPRSCQGRQTAQECPGHRFACPYRPRQRGGDRIHAYASFRCGRDGRAGKTDGHRCHLHKRFPCDLGGL